MKNSAIKPLDQKNNRQVCTYCLQPPSKDNPLTHEHFFPETWYTEDTPLGLEKWTVPVHRSCNHTKSKLDEEFFHLFAAALPEGSRRYKAIRDRHLRAHDFNAGKNFRDKNMRLLKARGYFARLSLSPQTNKKKILPVLQPPNRTRDGQYVSVQFDNQKLQTFYKYMVRGFTFKLFRGKLIDDDFEIRIFLEGLPQSIIDKMIQAFGGKRPDSLERGPGLKMAWYHVETERAYFTMYNICIWENYTFYAWVRNGEKISSM